jgi:hypothetical protein
MCREFLWLYPMHGNDVILHLPRARMKHISEHDLERYYLGMIKDEAELAPLEEHLLWCSKCIERAEAVDSYVDHIRIALLRARGD